MKKTNYKDEKRLIPDIISPNKITILRLILIPVFILFFYLQFNGHYIWSAVFFALAALTDFLDGYIARKYNVVTTIGKFLDPIADKVLVSTAFILILTDPAFMMFRGYSWIPVVMGICVSVIMARELIISGFREIAAEKKLVLAAGMLGKIKTFIQDIAITVILVGLTFTMYSNAGLIFFIIGFVFFALATVLTIASGIEYLVSNRQVLNDK